MRTFDVNMSDNERGLSCSWEIENYSMLSHQVGEAMKGPTFVVDKWKELEWWLTLYPKGKDGENKGYFSLYLHNNAEDVIAQKFSFSVTLVSTEPSSSITRSRENYEHLQSNGFPKFAILSDIFEKEHLYLPHDTLTLLCHLLPIEDPSERNIVSDELESTSNFMRHCTARSGVLANRRSLTLHVQNIKELRNRLEKASFVLETAFTYVPYLKVSLHFLNIEESEFVRIEIRQTDLPLRRQFVKCKMTVVSAHKDYQHSKESSHLFESSLDDIWDFPDFLLTSNLTSEKYLYLDDTLLLQCDFAYSCSSTEYQLEKNDMPLTFETIDQSISELVTNVEELYLSGEFCDVKVLAGDETFPVHKVVLCAMSPVFRAMFENDTKEKKSNVVEIDDVDPDTLRRMLGFMYYDVLKEDLSLENACLLFRAADKYLLETLRRRCAISIASSLSVASVGDVLVLADTYQDNFLLTAVHNFICSHTNETFFSDHWKKFMDLYPKLSGKILHQMWIQRRRF